MLFLFAAEDGKDHYVEESEATTCETRADESFLLQKPVTRAKLEARTDSLQVPHSHLSMIIAAVFTMLHCSYSATEPLRNIQH